MCLQQESVHGNFRVPLTNDLLKVHVPLHSRTGKEHGNNHVPLHSVIT